MDPHILFPREQPQESKNHTVGWILVDDFFGLRHVEEKIPVFVVSSKILLFH